MDVSRQESTVSRQEEENSKKFRIDTLRFHHVVWMIGISAAIVVVVSLICNTYVPPLLMTDNDNSLCPDNERSVRISLFCGLFNMKVNKEWFSYTQPFSSVEYLLMLRASPILLYPAKDERDPPSELSKTPTGPSTVGLLYSIQIVEVDQDYSPLGTVHSSDYNKVTFRCSSGNKHCSTEQLFFSTSITSGRYLVRMTPLNLEMMKTVVADIKLEMTQLNSDANFFLTFFKALLLFSTGFYFYIFAHQKWVQRRSSPWCKEERQVFILGITCLLVNFPTILFSIAITSFFANLLFMCFLVSMLSTFLYLWATFFETTLFEKYPKKLIQGKIGFIGVFWAVAFTGFVLFAYYYKSNPAFHIEHNGNVALDTFYYMLAALVLVYVLYIKFCAYLLWKNWAKQLPRTKYSAMISSVFLIALVTLMLTSVQWDNTIFLSSSKLAALLFVTNLYTNLLMHLYSKPSPPADAGRQQNPDNTRDGPSSDSTNDNMAVSMNASSVDPSQAAHGHEMPWRDGAQMATIRTLDTKATMKSVSRHSQSSAAPVSVNIGKQKDTTKTT